MPSWRKLRVVSPIASVGKSAKQMEMSIAVMMISTLLANFLASKVPSSRRNFMRFSEARLQEELSSDMYSLHGFEAAMRPDAGGVGGRSVERRVRAARVRGGDAPRLRGGVPVVDGVVVLHTRVGALPRGGG